MSQNDIDMREFEDLTDKVDALDVDVKEQTKVVNAMHAKVFNGFESKIDNLDGKLERYMSTNDEQLKEIRGTLSSIIKFGATALVTIFVALLAILGSVWNSDRTEYHSVSRATSIERGVRGAEIGIEALKGFEEETE